MVIRRWERVKKLFKAETTSDTGYRTGHNGTAVLYLWLHLPSIRFNVCLRAFPRDSVDPRPSIRSRSCLEVCTDDVTSNFYQRAILSSQMGTTSAGKPLPPFRLHPAAFRTRIYPPFLHILSLPGTAHLISE